MDLIALADRLEAAGVGVKAESIFLHMMPAEAQLGVLLRSPLNGVAVDWELIDYYKSSIQVIARSHDFEDGEAKIKAAVDALTIHMDTQVGGMWVRYLRAATLPAAFPLSKGNFTEFNVRMDICYNGKV